MQRWLLDSSQRLGSLTAGLLLVACTTIACKQPELKKAGAVSLPPSDEETVSIAPGAPPAEFAAIIDEGLKTKGKGPDHVWFVLIRDADRHDPAVKESEFQVVVGAGKRYPAGALRVRRKWLASGRVDGRNEELQTLALSIVMERGAPRPYPEASVAAIRTFCSALAKRVSLHPDCVVAMGEVPYARAHEADADERAAVRLVRAGVPVPAAPERLTITRVAGGPPVAVAFERRATTNGIRVGMMLRRRFDGENRGMLFEYPAATYRRFWMRNCHIPIDLAYIVRDRKAEGEKHGRIDEIKQMKPAAGLAQPKMPFYPSRAAVKYVLEMPKGWFAANGIKPGDAVKLP